MRGGARGDSQMGAPLPGHGVLRGRKYERVECSQNQTGTGQREGRDEGGGGTKCVCVYWSGHGGEKTKSHLSGMKVGCVQAINTREDGVGWDGMVVTSATARCGEQAGAAPVLFGRCDRSV